MPKNKQTADGAKLFQFTEIDELKIDYAKSNVLEFMNRYGGGQRPKKIDLSHYANRVDTTENENNRK